MSAPPRLAERLLRRLLPEEIADPVIGDLREEWARRVRSGGAGSARLWYWAQVARMPYGALGRWTRRLRGSRWRSVRAMTRRGGSTGRWAEEVRVGARTLVRRPGFAGVVVATLAASIGAATLVFSVLDAVLLRTLPYPDADRLVSVYALNEGWRDSEQTQLRALWNRYPLALDQVDAVRGAPGIEAAGAAVAVDAVLRGEGGSRRISVAMVSDGLFGAVGVGPALGRLPDAEELATGAAVAVVSHGFWRNELGGDRSALGRRVVIDGEPRTVIGVMPAGFWFPTPAPEVWLPLPESLVREGRSLAVLPAVARLAPGAPMDEVGDAVDARVRGVGEDDPARAAVGARIVPRRTEALESVREGLTLLGGAVALVVLLAAVNLANLVLSRASRREGELAVRRALGGGRVAVAWSLVSEVLVLCVVGGALGVGAAVFLVGPFGNALADVDVLVGTGATVNGVVLGLAAGTTLLAALAASLPVAWRAVRSAPARTLGTSRRTGVGRGGQRVQRGLLVAESFLAFVLLAGAALLLRSVSGLARIDSGYDAAELSYVEVAVPEEGGESETAVAASRLLAVAEAVAGRTGFPTVLVQPLPTAGTSGIEPVRSTGTGTSADVTTTRVGAGFFSVAGLPLVRGRDVLPSDHAEAPPVAVVGESLGRRLAGGGDPLGMEVVVGNGDDERTVIIVGVAADARMLAIPLEGEEHLYLPFAQFPRSAAAVLVRSGEGGAPGVLREAVTDAAPDAVVEGVGTVEGRAWEVLRPLEVRARLLTGLAVLALLLAGVGVAGVAAHAVEARTREIGVRIALGALPRGETRRVTLSYLGIVATGTVPGLVVALFGSRLLDSFLFEIEPLDPLSYLAAAALLVALGALAAWVPARRATLVDPVRVLNRE